jgi:sugar (pentulose or hexulose) kinase
MLGLLDIQNIVWHEYFLNHLNIEPGMLSKPLRPANIVGEISSPVPAEKLGVPCGIPLYTGSLDHHAAALGAGLGRVADVSISLGTVIACVSRISNCVPKKNVCIAPSAKSDEYNQLTFDTNGAVVLECTDLPPFFVPVVMRV